ncbi:MAG: prepilin peptidase [Pseudoxanthomonas sp.]
MTLQLQLDLVLLLVVVVAAITDLAIRKIPNKLLLAAACAVLALHLLHPTPSGLSSALGGAAIGFALFLPLYVVRGMAAGDVKMMATVGLVLGPSGTVYACVMTWCVGGVMALVIILFTRRWSAAYTNLRNLVLPLLLRLGPGTAPLHESVGSMPYGLAIALSTLWLLAQRHLP